MKGEPRFLTLEHVLRIHKLSIELFGGSSGLRDMHLLESALAAPQAGFGDAYFHRTIHAMAAAYLYHLCLNHAFVDGNKRVAAMCAYAFLEMNGFSVKAKESDFEALVMRVAQGAAEKSEIEQFFRKNTQRKK